MIGKNVIERSWHTIRFLAFHKFSLSFSCLLLRLVLAVFGISYAWMFFSGFSATSTFRREILSFWLASHFTFCLYSSSIRVPILIFCVFFFYIISHSRRNRFSTMSPPRREILIKLSFPGKGGRWRLCMALWAAWVERVISSLPTLARRTLLEDVVHIVYQSFTRMQMLWRQGFLETILTNMLISRAWLIQLCHFTVLIFIFFDIDSRSSQHQHCPDMKRKGY